MPWQQNKDIVRITRTGKLLHFYLFFCQRKTEISFKRKIYACGDLQKLNLGSRPKSENLLNGGSPLHSLSRKMHIIVVIGLGTFEVGTSRQITRQQDLHMHITSVLS